MGIRSPRQIKRGICFVKLNKPVFVITTEAGQLVYLVVVEQMEAVTIQCGEATTEGELLLWLLLRQIGNSDSFSIILSQAGTSREF